MALYASDAELDVLSAALSSMGLSIRSGVAAPTGGRSAKLVIDSRLLVQAFVVVAFAVAGHVARAPSVPWLAIPVVAALFLGGVQWTEQVFEVPARSVEDKLGAVEAAAWQEAALIRRTIRDADSAAAARRCVAILLELIGRTRDGGRHLLGADAASLDHDLHALLCRSLRLAAATDRVSAACNLPDRVSPRHARLAATRVEMLAALAAIAQKLDGLGASLVELHGVEARNELFVGASSRLSEIQVSVQTGIELAALVDDTARGAL